MDHKDKKYTQYFSKWRGIWVNFKDGFGNNRVANPQDVKEMEKFNYKLR